MTIKKILVPTDFSDSARMALQRAEQLARTLDAELILLHVRNEFVPDGVGFVPVNLWAQEELVVDAALKTVLGELRARGTSARALQVLGVATAELAREVEREQVDLIVMGTHGRHGFSRLFLGSMAEQVTRTSKAPVMVVRKFGDDAAVREDLPATPATLSPYAIGSFKTVLVPVNLQAPDLPAIAYAFEAAERLHAKVHLLYAYPDIASGTGWLGARSFDSPYQQALARLNCLAFAHQGSPAVGSCVATHGHPSEVISSTALDLEADLIVLSTDARGGICRFLNGSVTADVLRAARCAVVVLSAGMPALGRLPEASRADALWAR